MRKRMLGSGWKAKMNCSTPNTRGVILRSLVFLGASAAALALTARIASAQQTASHPMTAPRHPVVTARGAYRPQVSASPPAARAIVPMPIARPVVPLRPAYPVHVARPLQLPRVIDPGTHGVEQNSPRAIFGAPRLIAPFFFSGSFSESSGLAGSVSRFGGMPLGFGLWPACDSAAMPGRFWTVGPCFGLGSYSTELTTPAPAPPATYIPPLTLFESPPSSGPAAAQPPSAPGQPATMVLYL